MVTEAATNPKVTVYNGKRKAYVFRACFIDPFQGRVAAAFAADNLKVKSAAVLYDVGNDYSRGLAEVFKATFGNGKGTIVAYESYQKDDVDFSALATKMRLKKPDLIFIPDYYNKAGLIVRQLREKAVQGGGHRHGRMGLPGPREDRGQHDCRRLLHEPLLAGEEGPRGRAVHQAIQGEARRGARRAGGLDLRRGNDPPRGARQGRIACGRAAHDVPGRA